MHSAEIPNVNEIPQRSRRRKRAEHSTGQDEANYAFETNSESGDDFSAGSEDEFRLPKETKSSSGSPSPKIKKTKGLRGISAHRAAVQARNSNWNVESIESNVPNVLISDRGRSRGLVRGLARGRARSRASGRNRHAARQELLSEHRELVESLEEEDIARGSQQVSLPSRPKLPAFSNGKF